MNKYDNMQMTCVGTDNVRQIPWELTWYLAMLLPRQIFSNKLAMQPPTLSLPQRGHQPFLFLKRERILRRKEKFS
jgi:hypothetical protein